MGLVNVPAKFEVRSFTRSWANREYLKTLGSPWIRRSRSFKVIDFGANRKRVCDFLLLVRHSNLGPILHRFGDIAGFFVLLSDPPLFHPNFGGVPVVADRPCWGQPEQKPWKWNLSSGREVIFEVFQPVWKTYLNVTDRQTDGRTDGRTDRRLTVA